MSKKTLSLLVVLMMGFSATASAEEQEVQNAQQEKKTLVELPQWVKNIKFSGYAMLQYQGEDKEGSHSNTFNLRLARFILDGKIGHFDWRAQIQGTNATGPGQPTVQIVDLYAEWRKYPEFKVRAGQFKRAFTFENPTRAGAAMPMLSTSSQPLATVLVRDLQVVVISVSNCRAISSLTPMDVASSIIRLESIMVKA